MAKIITLDSYNDKGGELTVLEKKLPFDIRRVFFITHQDKNQSRANHANRKLQEGLICLTGSCRVSLDDGMDTETIILHDKTQCLLVESMHWIKLDHFSHDCVLLVLASEYYDDGDHIHDYAVFKKEISAAS